MPENESTPGTLALCQLSYDGEPPTGIEPATSHLIGEVTDVCAAGMPEIYELPREQDAAGSVSSDSRRNRLLRSGGSLLFMKLSSTREQGRDRGFCFQERSIRS